MTLGTMILQTSVKISIFLQDLNNPTTRGYVEVCLCVAFGASGGGEGCYSSGTAGGDDMD